MLHKQQGQLNAARPLYEEALRGQRQTLGNRHESTLTSMYNLASLLKACGELEAAGALFEEELLACRDKMGSAHPNTLQSIGNLGSLRKDMGQHTEALVLLRELRGALGEAGAAGLRADIAALEALV